MRNSSATAWVREVRIFCPISTLPVNTVIAPVSEMCSHAPSSCGMACRRVCPARFLRACSGLMGEQNQKSAAQQLEKIAPVGREPIERPFVQLIAFGFEARYYSGMA